MIFQKLIAIDFDGTITSRDDRKPGNLPEPRKNAISVINQWYEEGYIITINTLRGEPGQMNEWEREAREYLTKYGIPFHYFNENAPDRIQAYYNSRKIGADIYIDDKNLGGLPEDFVDIDRIVKSQIGLPYKRTESLGWVTDENENKGSFSSNAAMAMERAVHPFRSKFSPDFIEKIQKCPIGSNVYNSIFHGHINEYEAIEWLYNEYIKQVSINTQMMMNMPKPLIKN